MANVAQNKISNATRSAARREVNAAINAEGTLPADGRRVVRDERLKLQSTVADWRSTDQDVIDAVRECERVRKMWGEVAS